MRGAWEGQVVGNAACFQPHMGPLFCTWLELCPGFLRGTGLAPAAGLVSLPFRLASYPLVCGIVTSFSYASDALFFTRSLYRYHALGAFFSPSTVARTLGPWPWVFPVPCSGSLDSTGVQARLLLVPTDGRAAKNEQESKALQCPGVAHVPQPGEGWAGRDPQGHFGVRNCSLETLSLQPQKHKAARTDG